MVVLNGKVETDIRRDNKWKKKDNGGTRQRLLIPIAWLVTKGDESKIGRDGV